MTFRPFESTKEQDVALEDFLKRVLPDACEVLGMDPTDATLFLASFTGQMLDSLLSVDIIQKNEYEKIRQAMIAILQGKPLAQAKAELRAELDKLQAPIKEN